MEDLKVFKTTETYTTNDYPYGRLRCTATFGLEFNPKKGFRSTFQTINPKTGRINKPKKNTYCHFSLMHLNDDGHVRYLAYHAPQGENMNKCLDLLEKYRECYTDEQLDYVHTMFIALLKMDIKARCVYGGAKFEDLKPHFDPLLNDLINAAEHNGVVTCRLDVDAADKCSDPNFNPFVVRHYQITQDGLIPA